jgi:hypothetical protein
MYDNFAILWFFQMIEDYAAMHTECMGGGLPVAGDDS